MLINYAWRQNTQIGERVGRDLTIVPTQASRGETLGMGQDSGHCIRIKVIFDSFTVTNVITHGINCGVITTGLRS